MCILLYVHGTLSATQLAVYDEDLEGLNPDLFT